MSEVGEVKWNGDAGEAIQGCVLAAVSHVELLVLIATAVLSIGLSLAMTGATLFIVFSLMLRGVVGQRGAH